MAEGMFEVTEEQLDKMMDGQVVMMMVELIVNGLIDC